MKIKIFFIIFLLTGFPLLLLAQRSVTGKVIDHEGTPLASASISQQGEAVAAVSEEDGTFSIRLKPGKPEILVISCVNYTTKEVDVKGRSSVDISLSLDIKGLEDVVVVGFGRTKKITNVGAVASVTAKEIKQNPTASIQNALAGRLPGFFSQQRGGQPGKDAAEFFIRGVSSYTGNNQPLIIVDDIEYSYADVAQLDVNEIESISILKDASTTAVYGIKGANGVMVVTTKRGRVGRPTVNVKQEMGLQALAYKPNFLNAYDAAVLANEGRKNDGITTGLFTDEELQKFKDHSDPYSYPDVNWFEELTNKTSLISRTNIDISGGTDRVRYFISGGYLWQNGMFKDFSDAASGTYNGYYLKRYNFRSNLDIQATKTLAIRLDLTGRFGEINSPLDVYPNGKGQMGMIYSYNYLPPFAFPVYNPNGSYGFNADRLGASTAGFNPVGAMATLGYKREYNNDFNVVTGATQRLDFVTEGLSVKANISYASSQGYARSLYRNGAAATNPGRFPMFYYNSATGIYTPKDANLYRLPPFNSSFAPGNPTKVFTFQGSVNYDRSFFDHRVYGLVLYNMNSKTQPTSNARTNNVPRNFLGWTFRAGYDYKQRYMVEFNGAYNGTDQFAKGHRYGFFPAISAGWNVAKEKFFHEALPFVDLFKIRGSYGLVGVDDLGSFASTYEQTYSRSGNYYFGEGPTTYSGIQEGTLANDQITWEKEKKLNIGVDITLFDGRVNVTVDRFFNRRYDILTTRQSVPNIIGIGLPPVNLGETENQGWDGEIGYRARLAASSPWQYAFKFTFSYAKNKVVFRDEAQPKYPWLAKTGRPIGQMFGYECIGFYMDQKDLDTSAVPATLVTAGDLKYKDQNNDGVIDNYDQKAIGYPNLPNTTLGLSGSVSYKKLTVSFLGQTAFNYTLGLASESIDAYSSNFQPIHQQRWTPETAATAKFPMLHFNSHASNTSANNPSTFWYRNLWYLRLKNIEVSYTLPDNWFKKIGIKNVRVYGNGYNLLTWTNNNDFYQYDPEVRGMGDGVNNVISVYPTQKIFNFGINASL